MTHFYLVFGISIMLQISQNQMDALEKDARYRYLLKKRDDILCKVHECHAELASKYEGDLREDIADALEAAEAHGVDDDLQLYDWCLIRLASRQPFYAMEEFLPVLDHPYLTPFAKARHVIMSFFAAADLQKGRA